MNQTKQKLAFVLGREHEICLAELKAVLGRFACLPAGRVFTADFYKITGNVVFANLDNFTEDDAKKVMDALAGTMKVFLLIGPAEKDIAAQVASIIEDRKRGSIGKINFGISYYGKGFSRQNINSIALTAKKKLKGMFSLRYVESRDSSELSTILTLKNNLLGKGIEIGLFDQEIGVLVAFNDPEEWNNRDYNKPAADKYSGMVPPKLARMMVNLALGQIENSKLEARSSKQIINSNDINSKQISDFGFCASDLKQSIVIDCFCGSGNILLEALMLGCDVVGSDISPKAVNDSKINIEWLIKQRDKRQETRDKQISSFGYQVFQADATSEGYFKKLVTCYSSLVTHKNLVFVAEPFLGEPKKFMPTANSAKGEYAKIKDLYLGFLRNVSTLGSRPSALVLCLIFPLVETTDRGRYSLFSESVDEIKEMGYTQIRPTMIYGRDYQVVKREIALLKLEARNTNVRNKSE